jgi:hypothetical protein
MLSTPPSNEYELVKTETSFNVVTKWMAGEGKLAESIFRNKKADE